MAQSPTPLLVVASPATADAISGTVTVAAPLALAGTASGLGTGITSGLTEFQSGSAAGHGSASATLTVQPPLYGSAGGAAGAAGALSQKADSPKRLFTVAGGDGVALSFGAPVWNITGGDAKPLGIGVYPSGYYGPAVALSGAAAAHAGATAIPGVIQGLAGTASGHAAGQGAIPVSGLTAEADAHGGAAATLKQSQPLSGEADGAAGATATGPQTPIPLSGEADGQGGASGTVGFVPVSGTAAGHADAAATLRQDQPLAGVATGAAAAVASVVFPPALRRIYANPVRVGVLARAHPINLEADPHRIALEAKT